MTTTILTFDKNGDFFNEMHTVNGASEITGVLSGNIKQIINGEGHSSCNGYYFFKVRK